ncbi:MAG: ATP-binding protein [Eubacteriales bacterium]|nr:ATP-binding protein [Eubacteriales bacterium]
MIVGRKKEIEILKMAQDDTESHFIAVYGRRRVGKTFLIREAYSGRFTFQHSGKYGGTLKDQLFAFDASLKDSGLKLSKKSNNWAEAFENLKDLIRMSTEKRKIIFIDELSWMDTGKSNMVQNLEHFWNGWASARKDIVLIVCTSATSWMISKIIHNKGGLYNRLTEQIHLNNFSLAECEQYIRSRDIALNRDQILRFYMVFGGVPYYWTFIRKGLGLEQNIDNMLFAKDAPLKDEFKYLYASIFKNPAHYISIIKALATKKIGMSRDEIIGSTGLANSGDLSVKLEELESCGFIRKYYAFGTKKKNAVYQLIDNFTLFYYAFMEKDISDAHFYENRLNMPEMNTWLGLAFERVCLEHTEKIKAKLGISGIQTTINSWHCKKDVENGLYGCQIDLLIVRKDQVINLCEMKFSNSEFIPDADFENDIRRKIHDFQTATRTKNAIFPTLITSYGMVTNTHSGCIQNVITMDDLFTE